MFDCRHCTLLLVGFLALSGCARGPEAWLDGEWIGRPERTTDRKPSGNESDVPIDAADGARPAKEGENSEGGRQSLPVRSSGPDRETPSQLEKFDFALKLDFEGDGEVTMQIDGEQNQSIEGQWQVIRVVGPGLVIQVTPNTDPTAPPNALPTPRRFEVKFRRHSDGEINQDSFLLSEVGADPWKGALLFERAE